jgi:hypothetical protein
MTDQKFITVADSHSRQVAAFLDIDGRSIAAVSQLVGALSRLDLAERHAFADWELGNAQRVRSTLAATGFELHQSWSTSQDGMPCAGPVNGLSRCISDVLSRYPDLDTVVLLSDHVSLAKVMRLLSWQGYSLVWISSHSSLTEFGRSVDQVACGQSEYLSGAASVLGGKEKCAD